MCDFTITYSDSPWKYFATATLSYTARVNDSSLRRSFDAYQKAAVSYSLNCHLCMNCMSGKVPQDIVATVDYHRDWSCRMTGAVRRAFRVT